MNVLRFPSESADDRRFLADVKEALHMLRVLLELPYDLDALAANPRAVDDAEAVVAVLEREVTS